MQPPQAPMMSRSRWGLFVALALLTVLALSPGCRRSTRFVSLDTINVLHNTEVKRVIDAVNHALLGLGMQMQSYDPSTGTIVSSPKALGRGRARVQVIFVVDVFPQARGVVNISTRVLVKRWARHTWVETLPGDAIYRRANREATSFASQFHAAVSRHVGFMGRR